MLASSTYTVTIYNKSKRGPAKVFIIIRGMILFIGCEPYGNFKKKGTDSEVLYPYGMEVTFHTETFNLLPAPQINCTVWMCTQAISGIMVYTAVETLLMLGCH